ncbi:MAG: TlpA disulfide reductase family protein [Gammaproteobacteria bacterium]|nr:TlpA disulfide reductase family protein [Gammaproteobacteria bacterium]
MKQLTGSAILICVAFIAVGICAGEESTFKATGKVINVGMDLKVVDVPTSDQSQDEQTVEEVFASPSVAITIMDESGKGSPARVEVASGTFSNGKIVLEGTITERANVLVSVANAGEEPITMKAVATPGENLSFVLFDYESERMENQLVLVGESRLAKESHEKFTVVGDLSAITDKDLSWATAQVRFQSGKLTKRSVAPTPDTVLLENGKFLIEGIVDEPMLVNISVRARNMLNYWGIADAIVEPGARISISPRQSSSSFHESRASDLKANSESDSSLHAEVIESWQNSSEFRAKDVEYAEAITSEQRQASSDSEGNDDEPRSEDEESVELSGPDPYDIFKELEKIKNSVLSSIAQSSDKPMAALLAMELGAPESRQIEMWDKLVDALDQEVVERRVLPRRTTRMKQIQLAKNAKIVVQGHMAPAFTLANLEGEEVTLSDVLAENEFVLVDFWASWCGPCIAQIPKLKELHSEYKNDGFEIVFVSIDEEYDDWKGESDRQELPWINLGDLNGWYASTMVDYGVQWVPTEFALNTDGEILKRELSPEDLENLLATHFMPESVEDSETNDLPPTD